MIKSCHAICKILPVFFLFSQSAFSFPSNFGTDGRHGRQGSSGFKGQNGSSIVISAEGLVANYNIMGSDGGNGQNGEDGSDANFCMPPYQPEHDLTGADGGDGGMGGNGGEGGDGGSITAYFENIDNLKLIAIKGSPGRGGLSNRGGRGGDGCRCNEMSWTTNLGTFHCTNGRSGSNAMYGSPGSTGRYGQIVLISQLKPVKQEVPSVRIDMAKMEEGGVFTVSKNHWENRRGARNLFAIGSDISDSYLYYMGRSEASLKFRWAASRPLTDFSGWKMVLQINSSGKPEVLLPAGVWVDSEIIEENSEKVFVFNEILLNTEINRIQLESFTGEKTEHTISIKDTAGKAHLLKNKLALDLWTIQAGQWKRLFQGEVPESLLKVTPDRLLIEVGKLELDPEVLKLGTQVLAKVYITRSLGQNSVKYQLDANYLIKLSFAIGEEVEAANDANLLIGNQIVGSVKKGEHFLVNKIQGDWIGLKKLDGQDVSGWINISNLKKIP